MGTLLSALLSMLRAEDRAFWVLLRKLWSDWERALIVVKPETVIAWHWQGFRMFWRRRSLPRKLGRPRIPREHVAFIRRTNGPSKTQTWRTFIQNHAQEVWACDFLTQYTAFFAVVHVNVTANPRLSWVKQQVRDATAWGQIPRFLVHDIDGIFGQFGRHVTVEKDGRKRSSRCHLDRWLDEATGIKGLPIPYAVPNASPHVERFMRTLREEALDHFIFLSADHIRRVVREFIQYYNGARPSQAIHGIPEPYPALREPPPQTGRLIALSVLGGVEHDYRLVA